jgi:glycine/D-amino acid oxidase-like deaminating enzyme
VLFSIVIRNTEGTRFYAFPTLDCGSVKDRGSSAISDLPDPDSLDRNVHPGELTAINEAVDRFLPGLIREPGLRVHGLQNTPNGHAVLGRSRLASSVWVVGGFSGPRPQDVAGDRSGPCRPDSSRQD